jgi:hypothetical protein
MRDRLRGKDEDIAKVSKEAKEKSQEEEGEEERAEASKDPRKR